MTMDEWKAQRLQPVAERLYAHVGQPYSGDMVKSLRQAAIRLHGGEDLKFSQQYLATG